MLLLYPAAVEELAAVGCDPAAPARRADLTAERDDARRKAEHYAELWARRAREATALRVARRYRLGEVYYDARHCNGAWSKITLTPPPTLSAPTSAPERRKGTYHPPRNAASR